MKLITTSKLTLFVVNIIIGISLINSTVLHAPNNQSTCENSCQICQQTVYQMKFHQMANCEFGGVCRNTCYKILENFNTNWSPFQPFLKDMFGKCEICFRAGYCTISQCKEQELKELEIINNVVNKASITAKVDENLLKNLPDLKKVSKRDIVQNKKNNVKLNKVVAHHITHAIKAKSTEHLVPQIQSLIKAYFHEPFQATPGSVRQILYVGRPVPSAADITFWNQQAKNGVTKSADNTNNLIKKLENTINKIDDAKKAANKKSQAEQIKKVVKNTKGDVKKVMKKYDLTARKLQNKENAIKKVLSSNFAKDAKVNQALTESLKKVQEYKGVVNNVKQQLKKEVKKLKN